MVDTAGDAREFFKTGQAKFGDEESIRARNLLRVYDDIVNCDVEVITCWECKGSGLSAVDDHMEEYYFGNLSDDCTGCEGHGDRYLDVDEDYTFAELAAIHYQLTLDGNLDTED